MLDTYRDAVYLFAGSGNELVFSSLLYDKNYAGRFFLIGQRHDLPEVLKRVDIFVNTFPFGGGLMSQIAAKSNVPIVSLMSNDYSGRIEDVLCQKQSIHITSDSIMDLKNKIKKLVYDSVFRKKYALQIKECLINQSWFEKSFKKIVEGNVNIIDFANFPEDFIEKEKSHSRQMQINQNLYLWLIKHLGIRTVFICPRIIMLAIISLMSKQGQKRIYGYVKRKSKDKKK